MITAKDFETVRGVYRIRRLLSTQDAAAESTYTIVQSFGVTREQVLALAQEEEKRRTTLLTKISELQQELSE